MYRKNVSGQFVYFALVNASTGAALTGATVTAYRALDNGAQATATGTTTELANGQYRFNLSQADTNGNYGSYLFTATNAVPVEKTVVFTAANPQDGGAFGLSTINTIDSATDATIAVVNDLDVRIPAALVSGRMDASVGSMAANTLTASALATDAINEITDAIFVYNVEGVDNFGVMIDQMHQPLVRLNQMIEDNGGGDFRFDALALSLAPGSVDWSSNERTAIRSILGFNSGGTVSLPTVGVLDGIKDKTDLITSGNISVLQDRVNDNTITMQHNENTSATVNLDEDTTSATLQFVVARPDGTDVLTIANGAITRTSSDFTVTITTAVTATIGQYLWSLRDLTGGGNRVVTKGVLTVQNAASIDA